MISSIKSATDECNENIFILISSQTVFLFDGNLPNIIYQTQSNTTIEQGLFYRRTNTILLLIKQLNSTYSISSLNTFDNLHTYWNEKSYKTIFSSPIYLAVGQRYLYLFHSKTMLLQTFTLPLISLPFKQYFLFDLPTTEKVVNILIDENLQFVWILYERNQYHQLYICQLKISSCNFLMNLYNLIQPIEMFLNRRYEQFYIHSQNYLMIFEYNSNQTDYSIHYLNLTTSNQFLTLCEKTNRIEYISTYQRYVCYQTSCEKLPWIAEDTSNIHTIQRLSSLSEIFYCTKQRRITKIILLILILIDLLLLTGIILWLGYKFIYPSTLTKQFSCGTLSSIEKDLITYF
ncbi:hypothetical protein I4U23_029176 [Adineta vaga]|nr:hypothetical protein I4U23_029176 [Adineta vaga]